MSGSEGPLSFVPGDDRVDAPSIIDPTVGLLAEVFTKRRYMAPW